MLPAWLIAKGLPGMGNPLVYFCLCSRGAARSLPAAMTDPVHLER